MHPRTLSISKMFLQILIKLLVSSAPINENSKTLEFRFRQTIKKGITLAKQLAF